MIDFKVLYFGNSQTMWIDRYPDRLSRHDWNTKYFWLENLICSNRFLCFSLLSSGNVIQMGEIFVRLQVYLRQEKPYHFLPNTSCRRTERPRWRCLRGCTWPARGRAWDGPWLQRSRRRWCRTRWWRCCGRSTWRSSSKCRRGRGRSGSGGRNRTTT